MELSFGEKIRNARKLKGLTQRQLAEQVDAKHNSISDWENNKNKPDPDTIELLCGILNITPNYLLATSSQDFSPAEKLLIKKYRDLDDHGREMVDFTLEKEWERSTTPKNNIIEISSHVELNAANERQATKAQKINADKIMTDDSEWE